MYDELAKTFRALDTETGVRAIVLTGAGASFCTGGDVHDIIGPLLSRDFRGLLDFTHKTCELVLAIWQCRRPIIAALNGTVAGAGAVIATAADIRIECPPLASRFSSRGSDCPAPTWAQPGSLPRIVGFGRATEMLMSGAFVTAEEAHRIGLYNAIVEPGRTGGHGADAG